MVLGEIEMQQPKSPPDGYDFSSGSLCLDFLNTAATHEPVTGEELHSYLHLVEWARQANLFDDETSDALRGQAAIRGDETRTLYDSVIALRETIYRLATTAIGEGPANLDDLESFNTVLTATLHNARLAVDEAGFYRMWREDPTAIDQPLWSVLDAAAGLLISPGLLKKVKHCMGEKCDWLFIDNSRNHSRRWCRMSGCGNRAKARRSYSRKIGRE